MVRGCTENKPKIQKSGKPDGRLDRSPKNIDGSCDHCCCMYVKTGERAKAIKQFLAKYLKQSRSDEPSTNSEIKVSTSTAYCTYSSSTASTALT